ncbi:hypothetical protein [Streptomyces sp. CBMA29]|uniref:hypothetical protein n=1 Tax=Streptomyces sp. CBMA29 TaxID=1896314 RepID=UPI001662145C|nr:hypothetical protein [Streptomyces sp. CBMA29]MBD0734033.1 hypothetical protein [Streptomyces sp. CBMA29]
MDQTQESGAVCPDCKNPFSTPHYAEFGYCDTCYAYTAVVLGDPEYVPSIRQGDLMRCCTGAIVSWEALHPGQKTAGTRLACPHHRSPVNDLLFDGEEWRWARPREDGGPTDD